ncbi:MAG: hypothetical protein GXP01_10335 [Alphaproteobacteria bacterium]|nr:hypothetical protein [Alphaproteobacteria bacterium]
MSGRAVALAATLAAALGAVPAMSAEISIKSTPIDLYRGQQPGAKIDALIWRGGLELNATDPNFGGLSDLTFVGAENRILTVTDRGRFVSMSLIYDELGIISAVTGGEITRIVNSKGNPLPNRFSSDAEALETIYRDGKPAAVRVGFENLTRVADFELVNGQPGGRAREVVIPRWLSSDRSNNSIEAVCIAPPASPVAGSTIILTEGIPAKGGFAGVMLGKADQGSLTLARIDGMNPTACAFAPDGDLYVLGRGISLFGFTMQVRRIEANDVQPDTVLGGTIVLKGMGGDVDNMEGLAISEGPLGDTRLTLVSDNNFFDWQRTIMLQFSLPGPTVTD